MPRKVVLLHTPEQANTSDFAHQNRARREVSSATFTFKSITCAFTHQEGERFSLFCLIYRKNSQDMKNVKLFEEFSSNENVNEGIFGAMARLFKRDKKSAEAGGKIEGNFIEFEGKKFAQDQIEYDSFDSTKRVPRVEGGKLIIANPYWNQ